VLGDRRWPASAELQAVLAEHRIAHQWLDPTEDEVARTMLEEIDPPEASRPVVLAADGRVLLAPTADELVRAAGGTRVG
jgi:Na+:H+ antiporter, NhaA family